MPRPSQIFGTAMLCTFAALAAVPAAHAQPGPRSDMDRPGHHRMMPGGHKGDDGAMRQRMQQGGRNGSLVSFGCGPRASERLEIAFVRLSHRVELTDTQRPLFDSLKTAALTEQTKVADVCAAARPAAGATERPDVVDGLKSRLAIESARVAALEVVVPEFEAFFGSLTDEQKAQMMPHRGRTQMGMGGRGQGDHPRQRGRHRGSETM